MQARVVMFSKTDTPAFNMSQSSFDLHPCDAHQKGNHECQLTASRVRISSSQTSIQS